MVWKKDQTVNWSPLPVLQSTENSEKKWGRNSKRFLMAELWLRHTGSVTTTSQSLKHTQPGWCEWQSSRRQLEPAQGTSRALPSWHQIWELRPETAQAGTTAFPKSCPGQLHTRDLARSALTPRTNLPTAQVLLEVTELPCPQGSRQVPTNSLSTSDFTFSHYF